MKRDSFIFYRSFYEAIVCIPVDEQVKVYHAIANYALNRNEVELDGLAKSIFILIKPQLDANHKRFETGVKYGHLGAQHGVKGGRPLKQNPQETLKKPSKNPQRTLKKPSNVNVNVNDNVNVNEDNTLSDKSDGTAGKVEKTNLKAQATEVLTWLNHITGKNYRLVDSNLGLVIGRLKSGATVAQCRAVIAIKNREWKDDPKMRSFLRPETLFGKTKFESYIAEVGNVEQKASN